MVGGGGGGGGGGGSGWGGGSCWGGQGRCEQRSEVFAKIKKKLWGGGVQVGGVRVDVNEELNFCEGGGSGWGVRVDVNKELKFLGKFTKKIKKILWGGGGSGCGLGGGLGWM